MDIKKLNPIRIWRRLLRAEKILTTIVEADKNSEAENLRKGIEQAERFISEI